MEDLTERTCTPCEGGVDPLQGSELQEFLSRIEDDWREVDEHHIVRVFAFDDFEEALAFTNRVGELAEEEGHHPEICLTWGEARIKLYTHAIDGLSENDFILAAKIDDLL